MACQPICDRRIPSILIPYLRIIARCARIITCSAGIIACCALCLRVNAQPPSVPAPVNPIRVNQQGCYPYAPKFAVVICTPDMVANAFYLLSSRTRDTVYIGRLGPLQRSANSSLSTRIADFSPFTREGTYEVAIPGLSDSYSFIIGPHAAAAPSRASLKGFYYQRSAMALEPVYAGQWSRPAGHPDTTVLIHPSAASDERPAGTIISSPGGWYDAGDYNKYIVNSGITMGTLFSAYEDFPEYYDTLHTNIPPIQIASGVSASTHTTSTVSSGIFVSGLPDILNEAIYNLRWMLTMQDPADGGVYHKCTNAAFDGMVMPGLTTKPRYVVQKGTAATLDFAAVTAQAARILKKFSGQLPGLADSCLRASTHAWSWAMDHPDLPYDQDAINKSFVPKITTGGYGDRDFKDEWYWAAVELMVTTQTKGKPKASSHASVVTTSSDLKTSSLAPASGSLTLQYAKAITAHLGDPAGLPSWASVHGLGDYTLLRFHDKLPAAWAPAIRTIARRLQQTADNYLSRVPANSFHAVMGGSPKDFVWGSNAIAANQGILLINVWLQTKDRKYLDQALGNLDYILGRNATGFCFITGMGTYSTMHPHHRPSVADGILLPVPGLLAGGPNPGRQDRQQYDFTEPETAYLDQDGAYASNEIAINWNAPLVYLTGALEALQYRVGYSGWNRQ